MESDAELTHGFLFWEKGFWFKNKDSWVDIKFDQKKVEKEYKVCVKQDFKVLGEYSSVKQGKQRLDVGSCLDILQSIRKCYNILRMTND